MRLEEAFFIIKKIIERKTNTESPTFPDKDSDDLIPIRNMIKECHMWDGISPQEVSVDIDVD